MALCVRRYIRRKEGEEKEDVVVVVKDVGDDKTG
jgi:hypothetical protein